MSTDETSWNVPVSYAKLQTGLRLVELPPELNELVSSKKLQRLYIKSSPTTLQTSVTGSTWRPHTAAPASVLCTDTQTYQLRQVQSSNTVLVARASQIDVNTYDDENEGGLTSREESIGLSAFATCSSFLELNPLTTESVAAQKLNTAEQWLQRLTLKYDEEFVPDESGFMVPRDDIPTLRCKSKLELYNDIPFSYGECGTAWRALCAFELNGIAAAPSAHVVLQAWKQVFLAFDVSGELELDKLRKIAAETAIIPFALVMSIIQRISTQRALDLNSDSNCELNTTTMDNTISLDKAATTALVGEIYYADLLYNSSDSRKTTSALSVDSWRALLPESWRESVSLDQIASLRHDRFKPTQLSIEPEKSDAEADEINLLDLVTKAERGDSAGPASMEGSSNTTGADGKKRTRDRNWHERFKKTRVSK